MNILLVYPRLHYPAFGELQEPLGILGIAGALRAAGMTVEFCDLTLADNLDPLEAPLARADAVGLSSSTALFGRSLQVLERVRQWRPELPVVLGGPHATACPDEPLQRGFDAIVIGEGEYTAQELFPVLINGGDATAVAGAAVLPDGKIVYGPPRPFAADLDALTYPARDLIDYPAYRQNRLLHVGLFASRGCPYQCTYCKPMQDTLFGKKLRRRSAAGMVREMVEARKFVGLDHFLFRDDTLPLVGRAWFEELESGLHEAGLGHTIWTCQARVDAITPDLLAAMKRSGCRGIAFGVESGSQKVLDYYHKRITVEDSIRTFDLCHAQGIGTHAFIMIGAPVETREDLAATLALVHRIKPDSISTSFTTPAPGSQLYADFHSGAGCLYADYTDVDYLLNAAPLQHPHLTREDMAAAQQELAELIPHNHLSEHLLKQRNRWLEGRSPGV